MSNTLRSAMSVGKGKAVCENNKTLHPPRFTTRAQASNLDMIYEYSYLIYDLHHLHNHSRPQDFSNERRRHPPTVFNLHAMLPFRPYPRYENQNIHNPKTGIPRLTHSLTQPTVSVSDKQMGKIVFVTRIYHHIPYATYSRDTPNEQKTSLPPCERANERAIYHTSCKCM